MHKIGFGVRAPSDFFGLPENKLFEKGPKPPQGGGYKNLLSQDIRKEKFHHFEASSFLKPFPAPHQVCVVQYSLHTRALNVRMPNMCSRAFRRFEPDLNVFQYLYDSK